MDDHDISSLNKMADRPDNKVWEEKRQFARKNHFVTVDYATPDRVYSEFIRDISEKGVFIETKHLISPGQEISMTFSLPGHSDPLTLKGSVVRNDSAGIGVTFVPADEPMKKLVRSCVEEI